MKQTRHSPLLALGLLLASPSADARSRGLIGSDCGGCHGYEGNSTLSLTPSSAQLGETASLRFSIADSNARVGGIYIELEDPSQYSVGARSALALVSTGVTHTTPSSFSGGNLTYELQWQVPTQPGATRFVVAAVAADDNGNNRGDEGNSAEFDVVYGCEPQTYFRDLDGDGFGVTTATRIHCTGSPPSGYAIESGDCADGYPDRYPGATEYCNQRDDDCDGEIDEGAIPVELYPDADGDGFYSQEEKDSGDMQLGCVPYAGYADRPGDCDSNNASANPDAEEICDLVTDEDCDGRIDERVHPLCGVGWCTRESFSCDVNDCVPGRPLEEKCNFIDDDCDGEVDEGDLCEAGFICAAGQCLDAELIEQASRPADSNSETVSPESADGSSDGVDSSDSSQKGKASCAQALPGSSNLGALLVILLAGLSLFSRRRTDD